MRILPQGNKSAQNYHNWWRSCCSNGTPTFTAAAKVLLPSSVCLIRCRSFSSFSHCPSQARTISPLFQQLFSVISDTVMSTPETVTPAHCHICLSNRDIYTLTVSVSSHNCFLELSWIPLLTLFLLHGRASLSNCRTKNVIWRCHLGHFSLFPDVLIENFGKWIVRWIHNEKNCLFTTN